MAVQDAIRILTELAAVNLHYAVADIEAGRDRQSIVSALEHVREVEACLNVILMEIRNHEDDPPTHEDNLI